MPNFYGTGRGLSALSSPKDAAELPDESVPRKWRFLMFLKLFEI
jgi:hypothetical protein